MGRARAGWALGLSAALHLGVLTLVVGGRQGAPALSAGPAAVRPPLATRVRLIGQAVDTEVISVPAPGLAGAPASPAPAEPGAAPRPALRSGLQAGARPQFRPTPAAVRDPSPVPAVSPGPAALPPGDPPGGASRSSGGPAPIAERSVGASQPEAPGPGSSSPAPGPPAPASSRGAPTGAGAPVPDALLVSRLQASAVRCYPGAARRFRMEGVVTLDFCLEAGRAQSVRMVQSSGQGVLDRAASECVLPGALPAGTLNGCFRVPIRFGVP